MCAYGREATLYSLCKLEESWHIFFSFAQSPACTMESTKHREGGFRGNIGMFYIPVYLVCILIFELGLCVVHWTGYPNLIATEAKVMLHLSSHTANAAYFPGLPRPFTQQRLEEMYLLCQKLCCTGS